MQNFSRIAREPDCFEHLGPRREHQARIDRRGLLKPRVAGMGIGPILRIGDNDKVPTVFAPAGSKLRTLFCELARTCCASGSGLSKLQYCPYSKYGGVFQQFSGVWTGRISRAAAGVDEILKVGLQRPARADLVLIDRRRQ